LILKIKDGKYRDAIVILNYQTQVNSKVIHIVNSE
jgi:hypothetical protein